MISKNTTQQFPHFPHSWYLPVFFRFFSGFFVFTTILDYFGVIEALSLKVGRESSSATKFGTKGGKMGKKFQSFMRLQLFNASHRQEIIELLEGASPLDLGREKEEIVENIEQISSSDILENFDNSFEENEKLRLAVEETPSDSSQDIGQSCTTCGVTFSTVKEQRQHFHLDWHRYNLKRKSHNQKSVNEEEFDDMMDGLSSISGSDGEDSVGVDNALSRLLEKVAVVEEKDVDVQSLNKKRSKIGPKIYFFTPDNHVFAIYGSILSSASSSSSQPEDKSNNFALPSLCEKVKKYPMWAVVMVSGGHFAGAIFEGATDLVHKTFHSYTVRAKQGGSQGSTDSKSGGSQPKSAGASLRRYNEQAFNQHVQELLAAWKDKLSQCQIIFYRAVSFNQNILFGGQNPPLLKSDIRLRTIPFPTKRPTFSEAKRVLSVLSTIEVFDDCEELKSLFLKAAKSKSSGSPEKNSRSKSKNIDRARSRSPVKREEPEKPPSSPEGSDTEFTLVEVSETIDMMETLQEYGDSLTSQERKKSSKPKKAKPKINDFVKPSGVLEVAFQALTNKNETLAKESILKLRDDFLSESHLWNQPLDIQSLTLLHHACKSDLRDVVWLLLESGCDPGCKDKTGKYPYNWAQTKDCRKIFMRFQAEYPDKYDYSKAQIPGPLTKEMEEEKLKKQKMLNKIKREKEKLKKLEKKEKQTEEDERTRFLNLSDREKRALAAERRLLGQAKQNGEVAPVLIRCFDCAIDITGKVPFEYNQNVFCSTKCLATHRKKFPTPLTL